MSQVLLSDPMKVKLERHRDWDPTAAIPGWIDYNQYRVFVYSQGLAYRNPACRLQVGWIGTQAGAQFSPIGEFENFVEAHKQLIESEAKQIHGNANPLPHTALPPPLWQLQAEADEAQEEPSES